MSWAAPQREYPGWVLNLKSFIIPLQAGILGEVSGEGFGRTFISSPGVTFRVMVSSDGSVTGSLVTAIGSSHRPPSFVPFLGLEMKCNWGLDVSSRKGQGRRGYPGGKVLVFPVCHTRHSGAFRPGDHLHLAVNCLAILFCLSLPIPQNLPTPQNATAFCLNHSYMMADFTSKAPSGSGSEWRASSPNDTTSQLLFTKCSLNWINLAVQYLLLK